MRNMYDGMAGRWNIDLTGLTIHCCKHRLADDVRLDRCCGLCYRGIERELDRGDTAGRIKTSETEFGENNKTVVHRMKNRRFMTRFSNYRQATLRPARVFVMVL
jgi:hypothetical protein